MSSSQKDKAVASVVMELLQLAYIDMKIHERFG